MMWIIPSWKIHVFGLENVFVIMLLPYPFREYELTMQYHSFIILFLLNYVNNPIMENSCIHAFYVLDTE